MSGQQIGTVVGGIVGAYFGYPQLGMAIGGFIGGVIDPTKVKGPHIGQGQTQVSTDGAPIAWVIGTAKVAGCLIAVGPRREVKKEDDGKGGPTQVTYEAHQDFAIMVCESSEIKNSTISSILLVEQDGKIVYDARPSSNFAVASGKWKANVDFLFGGEAQLPHPTLEAIFGVGKTPAYRGRCVVVFKDFNLTPFGDRIPTFLFTVASETSGDETILDMNSASKWHIENPASETSTEDYSALDFDDSSWSDGVGTVGNFQVTTNVNQPWPPLTSALWIRKYFTGSAAPIQILNIVRNDWVKAWVNGVVVHTDPIFSLHNFGTPAQTQPLTNVRVGTTNVLTLKVVDDDMHTWEGLTGKAGGGGGASIIAQGGIKTLADVVTAVCERGNLDAGKFDATQLASFYVGGYAIATQCSAADALLPALQAAFAFGTEVDGKLLFKFYGEDVLISINDNDAVINDASSGAIQKTKRNQATEFPQKIVGQYIDPAQNYNTVAQQAERLAQTVVATGETDIQMPIVITAAQAKQAVDKALKVAYATLEGTIDLSVPYATASAAYLKLAAGEPVFQSNKRWVTDEVDIGVNFIKISGRYDRQSAYTSAVQPITGNTPIPPTSMFSGPAEMMVMNLPSLRTQDTYGVYIAVKGIDPSWKGANIQISYDNQQSWQNLLTATLPSVMGTIISDLEDSAGNITTHVDTGGDEISSITTEQMNANGNAFAIVGATSSGASAEIRQAQFAALQSDGTYLLTGQRTGLNGTDFVLHQNAERFTMLSSVYFAPIDLSFKDRRLYFRAVGFGEVAEDAEIQSLVYEPDTTIIYDGGKVT